MNLANTILGESLLFLLQMSYKDAHNGKIFDLKVLKKLFAFVRPYRGTFFFLIFLTLSLAVLAPVLPYLIQRAIDKHIVVGDYQGLLRITLFMIGLLVIQALMQYGHTYLSAWLGQYVIRDIRIKLYAHILHLRIRFFDKTPIGKLVTRSISDTEALADVFSEGLAALIGDLLQLLFIIGVMFYTDWKLTLISLATLPFLIISAYIFKEHVKIAFNKVRNAVANLNVFVQEHITGMSIVQIFSSEERELEKFKTLNEAHKKANLKSVLYHAIYFPIVEVIQATAIGLLVWYGVKDVIHEKATIGVLTAFIMYIQLFFRPMRFIAERFNTLQMGIVSTDRIIKLLQNDEQIPNNGTYQPSHLRGEVAFKKVWFAYEEEDYVLKNISFRIDAGKSLAIVGATGAGKSTIIHLMERFYDIERGSICIDGVNIKDYDITALRRQVGLVLQDVFLFSASIYENITLGNAAISKEEVIKAAKHIGIHQFILQLPGGYDYNVKERGVMLSMGQRQLITFARTLLYNPKILILDEATSSIDTATETLIQQATAKLMQGRTSIVIAHRLSTIQHAHKILVLEQGKVKEQGTHEDLLTRKGYYTELYNTQYKEV